MTTTGRDFFERFALALNASDLAAMEPLVHPEFTSYIPQSGELSRGFEGFRHQVENYPGGHPMIPDDARMLGDDERWALSPAFTVVPLAGGNKFTLLGRVPYPDGSVWHVVMFLELRDEKLFRMENYFAPEMPAPLAESIATYRQG